MEISNTFLFILYGSILFALTVLALYYSEKITRHKN